MSVFFRAIRACVMGPTIITVKGDDSTAKCVIEFDVKPMSEFCDGLKFWCYTSEFVRPREPGKKIYFERVSTSSASYTREREIKMLENNVQINARRLQLEEHEQRITPFASQIKEFVFRPISLVISCYRIIGGLVNRVRHANSMTRFNEIYILIAIVTYIFLCLSIIIQLEKNGTKWLLEQAGSGNDLLVKKYTSHTNGIGYSHIKLGSIYMSDIKVVINGAPRKLVI